MSILHNFIKVCVFFFSLTSLGQTIVFQNSNHVVLYERSGENLNIVVEDLNDFTLDHNFSLPDSADFDYVILLFDQDQSGDITSSGNTDIYLAFNPLLSNKVCAGYLLDGSSLNSCGTFISETVISVQLEKTLLSSTDHVVYRFVIPFEELTSGANICGRLSTKVHRAGTATSAVFNLPSAGAENYFVNPYSSIQLYENVNLGADRYFCAGDTLHSNAIYSTYLWSDLSSNSYLVPTVSGNYFLTVKDETCGLSDTVNLTLRSDYYCSSADLSFPSIITPNNDGINDIFEPFPSVYLKTVSPAEIELKIYNRWGVQVGGKIGYPSWDGYLDWGKKAPQGTYFYVVEVSGSASYITNGYFTLID